MDLSERRADAARHPWELARSAFFRRLIAEAIDLGRIETLLDIGAGDGWFAHELLVDLAPATEVTCWDINYTSADLNSVLPPRITRTTEQPPGRFDALLLMDVLEHIEHDEAFLRDTVVPMLADDGTLIVSVPAHPRLFSAHDTRLGHFRRYRPADITGLLGQHLAIVAEGSLFTSLTAARAAGVVVEKVRGPQIERQLGVGGWDRGPSVTKAITAVLDGDARFGRLLSRRGWSLPGLSYWAVCRPLPR